MPSPKPKELPAHLMLHESEMEPVEPIGCDLDDELAVCAVRTIGQADALLTDMASYERELLASSDVAAQAVAEADAIAAKEEEIAARARAAAAATAAREAARIAAREQKALAAQAARSAKLAAKQLKQAAKPKPPAPSTAATAAATAAGGTTPRDGAVTTTSTARKRRREPDIGEIVLTGGALGGGPSRIESIKAVDIVTPGVRSVEPPEERIKRMKFDPSNLAASHLDDSFYQRLHAPHEKAERERYSAAISSGRRGAAGGGGAPPAAAANATATTTAAAANAANNV
ncbi:bromodomain-containing protein [Pycnococcus provasolii]